MFILISCILNAISSAVPGLDCRFLRVQKHGNLVCHVFSQHLNVRRLLGIIFCFN